MAIDVSPSGHRAVKFDTVGDSVKGTIIDSVDRPHIAYGSTEQATRRDGTPITEWVINLQTDERDPSIEDDDGKRTLYVNKWRMKNAIAEGVKAAGQKTLDDGARLLVRYSADGDAEAGRNAPKLFEAQYKAPEKSDAVAVDELL